MIIGDNKKTEIILEIKDGQKYSFNKNRFTIEKTGEGYLITDADVNWDGRIISVKKSLHNYDSMKFFLYKTKINNYKKYRDV